MHETRFFSRLGTLTSERIPYQAGCTKKGTPKFAKPSEPLRLRLFVLSFKALRWFQNSEIKLGMRLNVQVPRLELFN